MATGSAQEIDEKIRDDQLGCENRVLKDISTIRLARRIVILACKHLKDRGEGKG